MGGSNNQQTPQGRLELLRSVANSARPFLGDKWPAVNEALALAEAAIEAIPAGSPGTSAGTVKAGQKAANDAIDRAWEALNAQQWARCIEETLLHDGRLDALAGKKHFGVWRRYAPALVAAWKEARRGVDRAMDFRGETKDFASLCRDNRHATGRAWAAYKRVDEAGGLDALEVFGPDGVGSKLNEAGIKVEELVGLNDVEILDAGLSEDDLQIVRRKIPAPTEDKLVATARANQK